MRAWLALLVLLAACGRPNDSARRADPGPADLERAAVRAGIIADPDRIDITGLYARDTDRLCIVPARDGFAIGAFVDYGPNETCSGRGTVTRAGETLHVTLGESGACAFDARYEGDRIVFPARLPEACDRLCRDRASLAALDVRRLSDSVAEASTLRDAGQQRLCAK